MTEREIIEQVSKDFDLMRNMLYDIQYKMLGVVGEKQAAFIQPLKHIIYEALTDVSDPKNEFLYNTTKNNQP